MAELNIKLEPAKACCSGGRPAPLWYVRRSMDRATASAKKWVATATVSTHFPHKAMPVDHV